MKKLFIILTVVCLVALFTACDLDKKDTYFVRRAGLSVITYNYIQTPGITAQQAYSNAIQYPVLPDPSLLVKSSQTRQQVIDTLNTANNSALTTQVMSLVDQSGAAFITYTGSNNLFYYFYVIIE